jgi:hypothetical protein
MGKCEDLIPRPRLVVRCLPGGHRGELEGKGLIRASSHAEINGCDACYHGVCFLAQVSTVMYLGVDDVFLSASITLENIWSNTLYDVHYMRSVDPQMEAVREPREREGGACPCCRLSMQAHGVLASRDSLDHDVTTSRCDSIQYPSPMRPGPLHLQPWTGDFATNNFVYIQRYRASDGVNRANGQQPNMCVVVARGAT